MKQNSPLTMTAHFTDYQFPRTKHGSDNPPLGHMNSSTVVFDFLLASKNLPLTNKYFTV